MHQARLPFSNSTHIGISDGDGDRIVPIDELRQRFGVDALIRLSARDFDELSPDTRQFVHFNLEFTLNVVGLRYAVVPIVRAGRRRPDGEEVLPVIDPLPARTGLCTEIAQHLPLSAVTAAQFAASLPSIRTEANLRQALLDRYARMFPDLSADEIVARGCAITRVVFDEDVERA